MRERWAAVTLELRVMTKPFYERLKTYFAEIGRVLRGEAGAASIFPNSTDVGVSRERIYAEFLRLHLPSSCNVLFGGFLFDQGGNESKQIDLVITNDSSLQFTFHNRDGGGKSFACIDGCIALVSLKSTLDSPRLRDALANIASIPDKEPLGKWLVSLVNIRHYNEWPFKIIYASNGNSLRQTLETLNGFYRENPHIPLFKRPNLIHVIGKYFVYRVLPGGEEAKDGTTLTENTFYGYPESTDVYALFRAVAEIQGAASASSHILYRYNKMIAGLPV
jgi:hypothetical protein